MNVLHSKLPLGPKANELFSWIASLVPNKLEAVELCRSLVHELGATEITVNVECLHVLCEACESLRTKPALLAKVEQLVKVLKPSPVVVLGQLDLKIPTLAMLDSKLEDLRETILANANRVQ